MRTWNGALAGYATAQRAAGRAAGTVRLHRHYLGGLAEAHRAPWAVTTSHLQAYLSVPTWAPETRKSARAAVRGFYSWGCLMGHAHDDPSRTLEAVRVPPTLPRPAPETVVALGRRAPDARVALMVMLGAYAGLRAAEIAGLHGRDLVGNVLVVTGKGGKVRRVPVVEPVLLARLGLVGDAWVFPNGRGTHLSSGHVTRLVSRELADDWTAHPLRHRFATKAHDGTGDLLAVMRLLGHSRPETTLRYVLQPEDALWAAVKAAC